MSPADGKAKVARGADAFAHDFTIARMKDGSADFSFSGIKTAVFYHVKREGIAPAADAASASPQIRDLVASFQRAVVAAPVRRMRQTAEQQRPRSLLLTGGVAANSLLRSEAAEAAARLGLQLFLPPIALPTHNAAMIGAAGFVAFRRGVRGGWDLNGSPHLSLA